MDIPYYVLLIVYLGGVGMFFLWMFFNVYHLMKFGLFDFTGKLNGFIFLLFSTLIFAATFFLLRDVSWLDTFQLFDVPKGLLDSATPSSRLEI